MPRGAEQTTPGRGPVALPSTVTETNTTEEALSLLVAPPPKMAVTAWRTHSTPRDKVAKTSGASRSLPWKRTRFGGTDSGRRFGQLLFPATEESARTRARDIELVTPGRAQKGGSESASPADAKSCEEGAGRGDPALPGTSPYALCPARKQLDEGSASRGVRQVDA
ncbi:hypothetical protein NDU88_005906 [Pleurodeles waltl]|uniref:Uncharacterized protein n=1 Tax=Pleurodeles waltl TaxID=8319 RepID=A0AAV7N760_PLEWA|nr:hypothetical protein NDU88_005906 [Pleurodeles waltl]